MREDPEQCYSARLAWNLPIHSLDLIPWYAMGVIRRKNESEDNHWILPIHPFEGEGKDQGVEAGKESGKPLREVVSH